MDDVYQATGMDLPDEVEPRPLSRLQESVGRVVHGEVALENGSA